MKTESEIDEMYNEFLYHQLSSLGQYYPLTQIFDVYEIEKKLEIFSSNWCVYNPGKPGYKRFGLSLTSLDGKLSGLPDLTSLSEYNRANNTKYNEMSFRTLTEVYNNCEILKPLISPLEPFLGRAHFLRFEAGGYFPFHRDSHYANETTFRIFVPLYNHSSRDFVFLLGNERLSLELGRPYFINTRIEHAFFALTGPSLSLILNIAVCKESVTVLKSMLMSK